MFVAAPGLVRWLYRFDPNRYPKGLDELPPANPAAKSEGSAV
jgi:hypothetical protein